MRAALLLSLALTAPADRWGPFAVHVEDRVARVVSDDTPGWERRFALPGSGLDFTRALSFDLGPGPNGRLMLAYGYFRQEWEDGGGEYGVRLFDVETRRAVRVRGAKHPAFDAETPSVWGRWLAVSVLASEREETPRLRLFDVRGRREPIALRRPKPPACEPRSCDADFPEIELRRRRVAFVWNVYSPERDDSALYVATTGGRLHRYARAQGFRAIHSLALSDRRVTAVVNGRRVSFALR